MSMICTHLSSLLSRQQFCFFQFSLRKGFTKGDPLSPIVFLVAFNPILDKLCSYSEKGYNQKGSQSMTIPFANYFNLCTKNCHTHQKLKINEASTQSYQMAIILNS